MATTPDMPGLRSKQTTPITYEDLQVSLVLGRGVVIDTAPQHAKISVGALAQGRLGISLDHPGHIKLAYQVEYEITGYDPADCTLTLNLVNDWRPGAPFAPVAKPPATPEG
jgi:hypothetical protein